ncbi:Sphingoid long-chain base transporter RSB1 [Daldinia childiae]|uniref:Sphingoid long-chain base transporter RSB1 n=1 Tax=Daldinia childiae TaxID=326645 RepID=UPI0014489676|nr:Sphingoid long-chain base transporter RSB1 [Daldinia childiae]KAF3061826.1 Sphingoid long-chain base transporter RSB1 [Daldinia childiae]
MSNQAESGTNAGNLTNVAISFKDCTPEICPYDLSFYAYRIDLAPNAVFLALFALSLIGFLTVFAITRRGGNFTIAMALGLISEIIGYAGRIMSWQNQWSENGFLIQICCLTIAPAFLAAGIYLCIRKIVFAFGPENSRIPPKYYTRIFIPCDIVSLILQAAGGGLASSAFHTGHSTDTGDNIMIAGLAFQVFTLLVFMLLSTDFLINTLRRRRTLGSAALDQDPELIAMRNSWMFKAFPPALALSTICIFWRSVFRVAELSNGWSGSLMGRQDLFIGFEGVMITVAVLVLNVFHPSLCFGEIMDRKFEAGDNGTRKEIRQSEFEMLPETKPSTATSVTDAPGSSLNTNDIERGA